MKKLRNLLLIMLCAMLAVIATGCGSSDGMEIIGEKTKYTKSTVRTAETYYSLTFENLGGKDVMPIGTWWGPYDLSKDTINGVVVPDYITDEYYELLSASGINYVAAIPMDWATNRSRSVQNMELAAKHNIGMFLTDSYLTTPRTLAQTEARLAQYSHYSSYLGAHLFDEPGANKFDTIAQINDVYGQVINADVYPTYTNLHPNYARPTNLSGDPEKGISYEEYVRGFADTGTKFISVDHYPYHAAADKGTIDVAGDYYDNLSVIRMVANEYEVPWWSFVQAGGQWEAFQNKPSDPIHPSEGETMWNINTNLAYGAKAIQYFCFLQPNQFSDAYQSEDYNRNGMLGVAGNINQWYYYIQNANVQIQAAAPVLMNSAHMGILATGLTLQQIPNRDRLNFPYRELTGATAVGTDGAEIAEGIMMGAFDYEGRTALYVVNCSDTKKQQVTLKFDKKYGYDVVQRGVSVGVAAQNLVLTLEKGEGALVTLR